MKKVIKKSVEIEGVGVLTACSDGTIILPSGRAASVCNVNGYKAACISGRTVYFHRVLAKAFLKDYREGYYVEHLNGNRWDNSIGNLSMMKRKHKNVA